MGLQCSVINKTQTKLLRWTSHCWMIQISMRYGSVFAEAWKLYLGSRLNDCLFIFCFIQTWYFIDLITSFKERTEQFLSLIWIKLLLQQNLILVQQESLLTWLMIQLHQLKQSTRSQTISFISNHITNVTWTKLLGQNPKHR